MVNKIHMALRPETVDMIRKQCKIEYLKNHKEMEHVFISDDKIVFEIAKWYLSTPGRIF